MTVTNYANGELTTVGTVGDEKLNSTTITNGLTVTIDRDQSSGGWTTQSETISPYAMGVYKSMARSGRLFMSQITAAAAYRGIA